MKNNFVIVGADCANMFFAPEHIVAHVRLPDYRCVYCFEHPNPSEERLAYVDIATQEITTVPDGSIILARRVPVNFSAMHDNEIDARWHALTLSKNSNFQDIYRVNNVSVEGKCIDWYIAIRGLPPEEKLTDWTNKQQRLVSTTDFAEVDRVCHEYRVSVICSPDLGCVDLWTARSQIYNGNECSHSNRSRAVIQTVLLGHYQADLRLFLTPDMHDLAMTSLNNIVW